MEKSNSCVANLAGESLNVRCLHPLNKQYHIWFQTRVATIMFFATTFSQCLLKRARRVFDNEVRRHRHEQRPFVTLATTRVVLQEFCDVSNF